MRSKKSASPISASTPIDILAAMNGGDFLYRTAMPDRIGLCRLIQQSAYLSDSHKGTANYRRFLCSIPTA
ncbi:hypothetical protein GCM10027395_15870 [Giesbergeria sinuosa]